MPHLRKGEYLTRYIGFVNDLSDLSSPGNMLLGARKP